MTSQEGRFVRKVAFVTGAASGIGPAAALAFSREGASVVAADVSRRGSPTMYIDPLWAYPLPVR